MQITKVKMNVSENGAVKAHTTWTPSKAQADAFIHSAKKELGAAIQGEPETSEVAVPDGKKEFCKWLNDNQIG